METKSCRQCKRTLNKDVFFYNGKDHTTCFSCSKLRSNPKNICKTCGIRACFNKEGETIGIYCKKHSSPDMVDVIHPKCIKCKKTRPSYNKEGETKALYCKKCAEPDMIDVKHPKCITCKKRASYGIPCNLPNRCNQHKEENMIKNPRAKCLKKNCNQIAIYGLKKPIHCETHKNDNDIDLVERKCKNCGRLDVLINDICVNFCSADEKAKEIKKYQKVKEKRVLQILSSEYRHPDEYNKSVDYSCGGKNSEEKEIGYDFGTHKVFIEVDESQHKSYCELGEVGRMKNIFMNEGGVPVLFIRYNPDNFYINNKRVNLSQAKREEKLIKWIKYYENFDNIKYNLSVHYLFYDNTNENYNENKNYEINPYEHFDEFCSKCNKTFYIKDLYKEHICT